MPQIFLRSTRIATTIRWAFSETAAAWYKAPHSPKLRDPPRRVSPRAFPKRFMNYVDRSWCGRSVCKPAARSSAERSWSLGRMLFVGDGFDGWIRAIDSIPSGVTLYQAAIVIMQSRHSSEAFVLFASIIYRIDMHASSKMLRSNSIMYVHGQFFMTLVCRTKAKIVWHYILELLIYFKCILYYKLIWVKINNKYS